jgi:hypothetical protein
LLRRFQVGNPRLVNRALRAIATDVITKKVGKSAALGRVHARRGFRIVLSRV